MADKRWILSGFLSKKKIRTQLCYVYLGAVFIPILALGIYLLVYVSQLLTNYYQESLQAENTRVRTIFSEVTTQVYKLTTDILFDEEVTGLLTTEAPPAEGANYATLYCMPVNQLILSNVEISDITIYTDNAYAAQYLHFERITEELAAQEWLQRAMESSVSFWTTMERVDASGKSHWSLCLVRRVAGIGSDNHAVMVVSMADNYLQGRINSKKFGIRILTDDNNTCFSSAVRDYGQPVELEIDFDDNYFRSNGRYRGEDSKIVFCDIAALSMYRSTSKTYIMITSDTAHGEILRILLICGLIILAALVLPLALILFFVGYFSDRVRVLRREMKKVSNEEYDILPEFQGEDELSEVFSDLQTMVKNIKEKDARVYRSQLQEQQLQNEQQKMEMKMLASQINPHFLYNTLESLRMQALTDGNRDVANSIKLLGKAMRYVLENTGTSFITLKKEIDYIETYLRIQKFRFGDRVNFTLEVAENIATEKVLILPFLLQPVIENAIVHGLEEMTENGRIRVELTRTGEQLQVTVADNGIGMDREELMQLQENMNRNTLHAGSSIGLGNINRRIRLCYGWEYRISIESRKGEGTRVILRVPIKSEED